MPTNMLMKATTHKYAHLHADMDNVVRHAKKDARIAGMVADTSMKGVSNKGKFMD